MKNKPIVIVFIIFFILLFTNLGNRQLWGDEGATSILSRNTVDYGYPKVYDGKNWFKPPIIITAGVLNGDETYRADSLASTEHSWLQYYIVGLSFALFGESPFTARLPMAIISFISLFFIYKLFKKLYPDNKTSILAMVLLLTSVFFFLYSRQVRHYPLVLLFTTMLLINYINFIKETEWKYVFQLIITSTLLFYSHFYIFFLTFLVLSIHFLFFNDWKSKWKKMLLSYIIIATLTLPWFIYANGFAFVNTSGFLNPLSLLDTVEFFIKSFSYHIPIIFFAFLPILLFKKNGNGIVKTKEEIFSDKFVFAFSLFPLLIMCLFPLKFFRGVYGFAPIFILFLVRLFYYFKEKKGTLKIIAIICLILFVTTNIFSFIPMHMFSKVAVEPITYLCIKFAPEERVGMFGEIYNSKERCENFIYQRYGVYPGLQFPIFYYLYEITHDYDSPAEGEVEYLLENGNENDTIFVHNDAYYVTQFFTKMRVIDDFQRNDLDLLDRENITLPEWILPRWKVTNGMVNELEELAIANNYIKIELPYPDYAKGSTPFMQNHAYWTNKEADNVIIYRRPE